jgi:hypothetical protein
MRLIISVLLICSQISIFAQRQADVIIAGNSVYCDSYPQPAANFLMIFNEDSLVEIDNDTPIQLSNFYSRASYADRQGNLKFATNGWRLVNSFGEVLAYKLWRDDIPWPGESPDTTLADQSRGPLFLEDPADSNRVYLFYGQYRRNYPSSIGFINKDVIFTFALLDVPSQSLISKDHIVLTDTTAISDAVAVRHGNGRDWWLIKPGLKTNEYYIGLLDPAGLSPMEHVIIPELTPRDQNFTFSHFTQDGNKFVHFTGRGEGNCKWAQRFDFDRCNGTLSNPIETDLNPFFKSTDPCNFTLSPDGSKFYATRLYYQSDTAYIPGDYQFDFETQQLTFLTGYMGLAFLSPNFKEVIIFTRLTPSTITDLYFAGIESPNELGLDCNLNFEKYFSNNFPTIVAAPNFANYRLGPLLGSECDPLTTNSLVVQKELKTSIDVFPNPSNNILNIKINKVSEYKHEIHILNAMGKLVFTSYMAENSMQINLEELQLNSGIYWVGIQNLKTGERDGKKFIKQ